MAEEEGRAAEAMEENTDEREEVKEEDGGNILDDILNTKEEKFEDEETVKKDEEDDENDLDLLGDEDSPGGSTREEGARKGPESDFSDSEDEESKAILRDGRDSEMSFKVRNTFDQKWAPIIVSFEEESKIDSGSESGGEKKEITVKKENVNEEGEDERDGGADEANAEKEDDGEAGEGDEDGEEKKKRKEKKSYDYATKLNYLFRETRSDARMAVIYVQFLVQVLSGEVQQCRECFISKGKNNSGLHSTCLRCLYVMTMYPFSGQECLEHSTTEWEQVQSGGEISDASNELELCQFACIGVLFAGICRVKKCAPDLLREGAKRKKILF